MLLHRKVFQIRNLCFGIEPNILVSFPLNNKNKQVRKTSLSEFSYSLRNFFIQLKYIILTYLPDIVVFESYRTPECYILDTQSVPSFSFFPF